VRGAEGWRPERKERPRDAIETHLGGVVARVVARVDAARDQVEARGLGVGVAKRDPGEG
tara:strand:+ start:232 stop:408 length:177 start_codon:yes stop_codon:yes gene_type:complete